MAGKNGSTIPQVTLDKILARWLELPPKPGVQQPFFIHRIFCHYARTVYHPEHCELISARQVGPFTVRLFRGSADNSDVWRIVETNSCNGEMAILTYGSGGRAREAATLYATDATEVDLTSDFDYQACYFGERRLPRK
jgi:hypothetical protein